MQQGPESDGASQRVRTGSTDCQFHCKGEKGAGTSEGRQDRKGVFRWEVSNLDIDENNAVGGEIDGAGN